MAVIISDSLVIRLQSNPNLPPFPLNHARIGYTSIANATNVTASSALAGFPADAAVNDLTYDQWRPASLPATWTVDTGIAVDADYIGIAGHNLASVGGVVTISWSADGVTWAEIDSASPADDGPMMFLFATITARFFRVTVDAAENAVQIGVIRPGTALVMQRSIYGGHTPITMGRRTVRIPNESDTGQALGETIIRKGVATSYQWEYLTASWYRAHFEPFVKAARSGYFFIAWCPSDHPLEVGYCRLTDDPQPRNMGIAAFMSVTMSVQGFSNA